MRTYFPKISNNNKGLVVIVVEIFSRIVRYICKYLIDCSTNDVVWKEKQVESILFDTGKTLKWVFVIFARVTNMLENGWE